MALDEHRAKFQPNLWNRPNVQEQTLSITDKKQKHEGKKPHHHHALENKYSKDKTKPTDIDEVGLVRPPPRGPCLLCHFRRYGSQDAIAVSKFD